MSSSERCEICGEPADRRDLLACALCGRSFHFFPEGHSGTDCGAVIPNPGAEQGC